MVLELITKQKEAVDIFFDEINPDIVQKLVEKMITKNNNGNVIYWSGVGKSYNIALHSSDMLKSMGFASFTLKPIEALHGDIGVVRPGDMILIYSKSGNTPELIPFMMHLAKMDVDVYGVFCNNKAKLAKYCTNLILLPCGDELDNDFNLVPTTSIISFVLFCNLIVSYYLKSQNINIYQYGKNHPSGNIGQRVWLSVKDIMYHKEDICIVNKNVSLLDCMLQMTSKRTGYAIIVDNENKNTDTKNNGFVGIMSDGDIRRYLTNHTHTIETHKDVDLNISIEPLVNTHPTMVNQNEKIRDIIDKINHNKALNIGIPVVDDDNNFVGFIDNKILVKYGSIF